MRKVKIISTGLMVFLMVVVMIAPPVLAQKEYKITFPEIEAYKKFYDDPRPLWKDFDLRKVIPPGDYAKMIFDVEKMKKLWAEAVGFGSPDIVGKIAPEIKPGTYTYRDKEKYPGLKELMIPDLYNNWFKPGGPPHGGNFPEIKVVPTRQYYMALPISEATMKNKGTAKLTDEGYLISKSYIAGYPFPQPSGKFKPQQVIYNWEKRFFGGDTFYGYGYFQGVTKNFTNDSLMIAEKYTLRLQARLLVEPYGWYDKRAETQGESLAVALTFLAPRDMIGSSTSKLQYTDPDKLDSMMMYLGSMRRIRKMTSTDTQDSIAGQDAIYDDDQGFSQKLTQKLYPYKYEIIDEREYLVPTYSIEGAGYFTSKEKEYRNVEFERRPLYVVRLTQLDPNYVYSKRIIYIDKETFILLYIENYDRKGRLYRSAYSFPLFRPEMGLFLEYDVVFRDLIDLHTTLGRALMLPVTWLGRQHVDLGGMVTKGK